MRVRMPGIQVASVGPSLVLVDVGPSFTACRVTVESDSGQRVTELRKIYTRVASTTGRGGGVL